jgi:hypothetical protein
LRHPDIQPAREEGLSGHEQDGIFSTSYPPNRWRLAEKKRRDMGNPQEHRPVSRLSDEELEYYGDLYLTRGVREAGVDFESYLGNPEYYLAKYGTGDGIPGGKDGSDGQGPLRQMIRLRSASRTSSS